MLHADAMATFSSSGRDLPVDVVQLLRASPKPRLDQPGFFAFQASLTISAAELRRSRS
jgi:hypothetical protein